MPTPAEGPSPEVTIPGGTGTPASSPGQVNHQQVDLASEIGYEAQVYCGDEDSSGEASYDSEEAGYIFAGGSGSGSDQKREYLEKYLADESPEGSCAAEASGHSVTFNP